MAFSEEYTHISYTEETQNNPTLFIVDTQ